MMSSMQKLRKLNRDACCPEPFWMAYYPGSLKAIKWFFKRIFSKPGIIEVYHSTMCTDKTPSRFLICFVM